MSAIRTHIRKSDNGHQVGFSIDHQTFFLQECEGEEGFSSKEKAEWYEKQLQKALQRAVSGFKQDKKRKG